MLSRVGASCLAFVGVWITSFSILFLSPWGQPQIHMDLSSSSPGFSQVFFADEDQVFTEQGSTWAIVTDGPSAASFPVLPWRGTLGSELRWDPLDQPAEMTVRSIRLRSGVLSEEVPLERLRPSQAVSEIVLSESGATFTAESNDPQILLTADTESFAQSSISRSALLSLGLAFVAAALVWFYLQRRNRSAAAAGARARASSLDSGPDVGLAQRIPHWTFVLVSALAAAGAVMLLRGSRVIGVSWDESIHERSLEEFFRSGWFIPRGSFVEAVPRLADASVYAPAGALLAHIPGALGGVHSWFEASFTAQAYESRHLAVAAISLGGLVASAVSARLMFRSWRWSVLTIAVGFSIPVLLGHSMFNIKDAPVAAAFSLYTLGLVILSRISVGRGALLAAAVVQTGAIVLGLGNRPGIWVGFLASTILTLVLLAALDIRASGVRIGLQEGLRRVLSVTTAFIVGFSILWAVYPVAFGDPVAILRNSLVSSQDFPWSGFTLTAGTLMPAQPPWTYIPFWVGAQLPLLVLATAGVGLVWSVLAYVRSLNFASVGSSLLRGNVPVLLQASIVPLGAVLLGSTLYGGMRQFLFVFPAVALLAVVGIERIVRWAATQDRTWLVPLTWSLVVVGLTVPILSQLRLFPFSHAYFNAAASAGDVDQNWDIDGWWLSGRELVEGQQLPDRTICVDSEERFVTSCSRMGMITPFLGEPDNSAIELGEDQYVALSRFPYSVGPDVCTPFREVTRGLFFQEVQLSHADVCTATLGEYAAGGLSFSSLTNPDPVLLWGWNPYLLWGWGAPDSNGVWMVEPEASVGFLLDDDRARPSELTITGAGSALAADGTVLRIFVNGVDAGTIPLPSDGQSQVSTIAIPEQAWQGLGEGRVVVRLAAEDVDPLALDAGIDSGAPGLFRIEGLAAR